MNNLQLKLALTQANQSGGPLQSALNTMNRIPSLNPGAFHPTPTSGTPLPNTNIHTTTTSNFNTNLNNSISNNNNNNTTNFINNNSINQALKDKKRKRQFTFNTECMSFFQVLVTNNISVKQMMYGFGDVKKPLPESIELMEDLVMEYITEMTQKAAQTASKKGKMQAEDLVFLIRKDKKKYARAKELLVMHEEIKRAKKAFEFDI